MPNWCNNTVIVDGGKREIARFVDYVKTDYDDFSFNAILPIPEELRVTNSPTTIVTQEEYDNYEPPSHGFDVGRPITQEMSDRFLKRYCADNWCDWANDNWGTKWDVAKDGASGSIDFVLVDWKHSNWNASNVTKPQHVVYTFDTAWSPPDGIYKELVKQFPKLTIDWHYSEADTELFGNITDLGTNYKVPSREVTKQIKQLFKGRAVTNAKVRTRFPRRSIESNEA